ncbi:hypothetical protein L7F22_018715 [Adiantum nelumboides]|nr:hypothetical protein [Adiantum nelumboides]
MKDLGELRYFLGIEIIHTKEGIWLSQRQYALDILSKYGMADCKPISMPLDQNVKLRADEGQVLEDVTMYRQIVGSLIYLTISRPNLSYSVGLESQFMQLSRKPHLDIVRRTLRYVSATLDYALFYEASTELQLSGFIDADWAGNVQRPVVIHCDNLSSIQLAQNPVFHARTKHIEVHYHFIRERVLDGSIDLTFVRTDEQVADFFTKTLGAEKLRQF